ncbi:hypothetical protein [Plantactinospora soyae]|uniref:Uncharacterized protein n=1 Tax=Plantactinospora soyae TaxID=1544732 RepID=A0A927M7Z3_9ACTN|nr:hypothetical protein [Plantactinospora soyae]MBE1489639.1 hypothetical protein [Plantactinospora soyae]
MQQILVQVTADDATDPRRLERLTTQLAQDLRAIREISVRPAVAPPQQGAKSATISQVGSLVVSGLLSAAGLNALRDIIVAYLQRSSARSITLRVGEREVILTGGAGAKDLAAVSKQLQALVSEPEGPEGSA